MPNTKFKFKLGDQKSLIINWKELVTFWKKPHNNKELEKEKQTKFKANIFKSFFLLDMSLSNLWND